MSQTPRVLIAALLIAGVASAPSSALGQGDRAAETRAPDSSPMQADELQQLRMLFEHGGTPGLSIAFVRDGQVHTSVALGRRRADTPGEVGADTVFEAASLSKPVFAWIVLELVEQGVLDLDQPLEGYFAYPDLAHDERAQLVTARQVLSHTSGLPNWRRGGSRLEFTLDPGTAWAYSGEGFVWLQRVVEHVTERSLQDLAQERVFGPLGMTDSSFVWRETFEEDCAHGHRPIGVAYSKVHPELGNSAHSLHTTASDYARFLAATLAALKAKDGFMRGALAPAVEVSPGVAWGLGWGLQQDERGAAIWHWGHNGGYRAFVIGDPERGTGLVYFTNGDDGLSILEAVLDTWVGEGPHAAAEHLGYTPFDPERTSWLQRLETLAREIGVAEAINEYFAGLEGDAARVLDATMLATLGYSLLFDQQVEQALEVFSLGTDRHANDPDLWTGLARTLETQGDRDGALASLRRALEVAPADRWARDALTRLEQTPH